MNYPKPFKREGSASLFFNYTDPLTGKRKLKSTGTPRVGESKEFIKTFIDRLTPSGSMTFREYASRFFSPETNPRYIRYKMAGKQYGIGHITTMRQVLTKHVLSRPFADLEFASINRGDILDLLMQLGKELKDHPATIDNIIKFISSIFSEAYYREDLKYNPAQRLTRINYDKEQREVLTPDEIMELFKDPGTWRHKLDYDVFLFAAYTGRRCGEILGLQWDQIKDGYCYIDRAYNRGEKGLSVPKWDKKVMIPLCRTLLERLPERGESPYVFTYEGHPLSLKWWDRASRRELKCRFPGRNIVPHSFRHSLNTNLILALGGQEIFVRKYIGWTESSRDTQAIYTHIKPRDLKFIADKIDEMYCLEPLSHNNIENGDGDDDSSGQAVGPV